MAWVAHRRCMPVLDMFHWTGTPEAWTELQAWDYGDPPVIKSTGEHIAAKELEVWDRIIEAWVIAKVGDYVVQELAYDDTVGFSTWWYHVMVAEQFAEEGWEPAPKKVYQPPGVYT